MPRKARPRARKVDLSTGSLVGSAAGSARYERRQTGGRGRAVWFMRDDEVKVV